jgi:hypothetical protein
MFINKQNDQLRDFSNLSGEQELRNIEKFLSASFERVILCSPERKTLEGVKTLEERKFGKSGMERISFLRPEEILTYLAEIEAAEQSKEERIKGYKVKLKYEAADKEKTKAKREAVAQVILQELKRMREKKN